MMLEGESTTMLFLLLIAKLFVDLICLENVSCLGLIVGLYVYVLYVCSVVNQY